MARPSKYRPEFCEKVIEVMGRGLSYTAFASSIGAHRDTLHQWTRRHPEFAVAVRRATARRVAYLEHRLLAERSSAARLNVIRLALMNAAPNEWRPVRQLSP